VDTQSLNVDQHRMKMKTSRSICSQFEDNWKISSMDETYHYEPQMKEMSNGYKHVGSQLKTFTEELLVSVFFKAKTGKFLLIMYYGGQKILAVTFLTFK
jgi:hypothetical protein